MIFVNSTWKCTCRGEQSYYHAIEHNGRTYKLAKWGAGMERIVTESDQQNRRGEFLIKYDRFFHNQESKKAKITMKESVKASNHMGKRYCL